ncbi:TM2 domain-containing protein [Aerococcus urinaeequi]|uniref:TM2 domain-containing protein n=1 Tax=Aerococcus urinaeequi TaxID=51665 RepID=UPI003D6BFAFA
MSRKKYESKTENFNARSNSIVDLADLDLQERDYVERKVSNDSKKPIVAWLLWLFLASFGGHRFYFGKIGSGFGMIAVTLFLSSWMFGIPTIIWFIYDAFQINKWLEQSREYVREDAVRTVLLMRK